MDNDDLLLSHYGGLKQNSLNHILNPDNENDIFSEDDFMKIIKLSPYLNIDEFKLFCKKDKKDFTIMSINIGLQCLNAKFEQLELFLADLKLHHSELSVICVQETWLAEGADLTLYQLDGYDLITEGFMSSTHGGLAIYVNSMFNYTSLSLFNGSNIWEGQFLEISKHDLNKKIIIGNLYRPPRDINNNYQTFINEFNTMLTSLDRSNSEIILAGDCNINLLKIHDRPMFNEFFDTIVSLSFYPQITLPTRFTDRSCTLIDNFFCKLSSLQTAAGIITTDISDHLPYCMSLKVPIVKDQHPEYVYIKENSKRAVNNFKTNLTEQNIYDKLTPETNEDPNVNYNTMHDILTESMKKHFPIKLNSTSESTREQNE